MSVDSRRYLIRQRIKDRIRQKEFMDSEIRQIVRQYISEFHFMDHKLSEFWDCDESPVGMCVFNLDDRGHVMGDEGCRYCGLPEERK